MSPSIFTTMTPTGITYRRTEVVYYPGWGLASPLDTSSALVASGRLLRAPSVGTSPAVGCHAALQRYAHATSSYPLLANLAGASSGEGLAMRAYIVNVYAHFGGASSGSTPVHAFFNLDAHTGSGRLLRAHPVGASPEKGPCHAS